MAIYSSRFAPKRIVLFLRRRNGIVSLLSILGVLAGCLAIGGCSSLVEAVTPTTHVTSATTAQGASLVSATMSFPAGFMTSVKTYGAVGNGVTDDTAAIQRALSDGRTNATADYYGSPKALYFPPGVYVVKKTLEWNGCCVTLQGAGPSASVIRLAPESAGFNNTSAPAPVIMTPAGITSFHQNIWDMGISIGSGNPGAVGISYISNNSGALEDVLISSEDGGGHAGIDLTREYAGPLLVKNVEVKGFAVGVDLKSAEYSSTFENITLEGQSTAGIRNVSQSISIENLVSENTVPAITNTGGAVVLLNAALSGGSASVAAIQTNHSTYLRNVATSGYKSALEDESGASPVYVASPIAEHLVGTPMGLDSAAKAVSLNLPVEDTPTYTSSGVNTWVAFTTRYYGDTVNLQPALNSGASTVYFPFGSYFSYSESTVTVPDTVQRIAGFSSVINGDTAGVNGGSIQLEITSNSSLPLVIDGFGYGIKILHKGSRPVVIRHSAATYTSEPGAGPLYLEDVELGSFTVQPNQQVWARQLNVETDTTKITNNGGRLWVLGLKTEQGGTVIATTGGGETELLGALIYPATLVSGAAPAFHSTDSQVSYIYSELVYCADCGYPVQIEETRSGVTRQITSSGSASYGMPLFVGYK